MNKITKCKKDCPVHKLFTHNTCIKCTAFKNSPYRKEFFPLVKDKLEAD